MSDSIITVEVAYATPQRQEILTVTVAAGTSVYQTAVQSGMGEHFPEIDLANSSLGIFGKVVKCPREQAVQAGERIEIYRPLLIDPKQARLNRAKKT